MNNPVQINVSALDRPHRQAIEDVLGRPLQPSEQLTIHVSPGKSNAEMANTMELIRHFYDGDPAEEVDRIDQAIRIRANFTREFDVTDEARTD